VLIAEAHKLADCQQSIAQLWTKQNHTNTQCFKPTPIRNQTKQLWVANTQVNFCAKAYPTVTVSHPDAAPLTVLGGFLRNGYLHRVIREQGGAYGGGASQDSGIAAFKFFSYRDPRLEDTLNDFDQSIQWMLETDHDAEPLEQAILGVISGLDKPGSPAGEAKQAFHNSLFGRSPQQRLEFRQRLLQVSLDDLKRVTLQYLKPELASVAAITSPANFEQLGDFVKTQQLEVTAL
jgi:Zn-dependent M16 (insulinase) family peptidase